MAICRECEEEYSDRRAQLGYTVCLECGEDKRSFTLAPAYNKGAYQLITREQVRYIGR